VRLAGLIAAIAAATVTACGPATVPRPVRRSSACDVGATWVGSAVDPSGVPWQLLVVLHQEGGKVAGTAEWTAEGGRSVEDLTGTVDCAAGRVTLRTELATYAIELSADDAELHGSWDLGTGQRGTLAVRRKPPQK
jgi:hypothetical protein